jgi:hypothetical protein
MLSTVMKDVGGVLSFGHVVVAASLLVLLRSTGVRLAEAHAHAMKVAAQGEMVAARLSARHEHLAAENVVQEAEPQPSTQQDAEAIETDDRTSEASTSPDTDDDPVELLD